MSDVGCQEDLAREEETLEREMLVGPSVEQAHGS